LRRATYLISKRVFDFIFSLLGLIAISPILLPVIYLVWWQDKHSPFYIADRVGKDFKSFKMVKLRSMINHADATGVDSTSMNDARITQIGRFIRKSKLDELTQLWNVFVGDMSLVGPRPNVKRETDLYTSQERKLLSVKPGITDFASIVFSDEGQILADKPDPDIAYNQLIRPGKSRLGLFYIKSQKMSVDVMVLFITLLSIFKRERSLILCGWYLKLLNAPIELVDLSLRKSPLSPEPPPGSLKIVENREI